MSNQQGVFYATYRQKMGCVDRLLADSDHHPYIPRHGGGNRYRRFRHERADDAHPLPARRSVEKAKASTADVKTYTFSDWAKSYVSWAKENGLLDIGTDMSDLTGSANRAEIAACLNRPYENVIEK